MDPRKQMLYQKTNFNHHSICHLSTIFKCGKCKRNNSIIPNNANISQNCIFCGMPNYIKYSSTK